MGILGEFVEFFMASELCAAKGSPRSDWSTPTVAASMNFIGIGI